MIGIAARPGSDLQTIRPTALGLLEEAFSERTKEIAHRLEALQNRPSPGSLRSQPVCASDDTPLEERLFDALASVKILTSQVAMYLDGQWRARLFQQLDSLHDPAEWEVGDQPVQQASFSTFLKAMLDINPERRPGLGLSYAGHLIAAWTTDDDRLTIEFLPTDRVRWVLARHHDGAPVRFAGETGVDRLTEGLATYHPEHWFKNVKKSHKLAQ